MVSRIALLAAIVVGATALGSDSESEHWAFRAMARPALPSVTDQERARTPVDRFIIAKLDDHQLSLAPPADRATLVRRVSFDLTGLPPRLEEIDRYLADTRPGAYERMVERYLASPAYGVRWGKYWLDAAGYADSNGYFGADTDRPLAYRYRDYVVRSLNSDKPFDQFVREQLAGDEISEYTPGKTVTPETIALLEATHYLRNGQDGSGESDGNDDEVRVDRYAALESTLQIVSSSLLGLTVQCAKCHDHKFEPLTQLDYYQLQSVFYPAFNIDQWVKPKNRFVHASLPHTVLTWEERRRQWEASVAKLRAELEDWVSEHRPSGETLFRDDFESTSERVADLWSAMAPGDDLPGGSVPVKVDSGEGPGATIESGSLQVIEGGVSGDRWLSTRQAFDWTPGRQGEWIEATFDLVADRLDSSGQPAERVAYFVSAQDFDDSNSATTAGNVLIDGNPKGGAAVAIDYPGEDSTSAGTIGAMGYVPGRNYGVRITNVGDGKMKLEHLVDRMPEGKSLDLMEADLPDGGFAFEYCCGRSFIVDNVLIDRVVGEAAVAEVKGFADKYQTQRAELDAALEELAKYLEKPGKIAWVSDLSAESVDVHLLLRGDYKARGPKVVPAPISCLDDKANTLEVVAPFEGAQSTGRRLAWARWVTHPRFRAAALIARVQVNRVWQKHFGAGIVATTENLGLSGARPSHPELMEWLTAEFVDSGWRLKTLHRLILNSAVYRQSSAPRQPTRALEVIATADAENSLLWRYPFRRLDAEAIRDSMLAVSGDLNLEMEGPYVPTQRNGAGEVVVDESFAGAMRRSLYLRQRRTQVLTFLSLFDLPSIVFNCTQRNRTTLPLQSLSLMNSDFMLRRARGLAARVERQKDASCAKKIAYAFRLAFGREPTANELRSSHDFLGRQIKTYEKEENPLGRAWRDFSQMLLASNPFLYLE
jgi:hypothetical protein